MPRHEVPYFAIVCTEAEFCDQLQVCERSDFRRADDPVTDAICVYDREPLVMRAERFGGGWLVRLHRLYYRHPFDRQPDGTAPPGVA